MGAKTRYRVSPQQRFMVKTHQEDNGCWRWLGCFDGEPRGFANLRGRYGRFSIDGYHMMGAHRASYLLFRGPIPEGLFVCHRCDVPSCVNPQHLFLGTNQNNVDDMMNKGRADCQREGWRSPRTGTGQYLRIDGDSRMSVKCGICNTPMFQRSTCFKNKKMPACSMACKNIIISWSAYLRRKPK